MARKRNPRIAQRDADIVRYVAEHPEENFTSVGKKYGLTQSAVSYVLKKAGVKTPGKGGRANKTNINRVRELSLAHPELSRKEMGLALGLSHDMVSWICQEHNIGTRYGKVGRPKGSHISKEHNEALQRGKAKWRAKHSIKKIAAA
jgi:hypothetical protein